MNLPPWLRVLLWPASLLYGFAATTRARLYAKGTLTAKRLGVPVVSVGNLTVGGTGKTPMVIWLAERFLTEGKRVAILSRGYKGTGGTSDEIELMKLRLDERVLFGVGPDRHAEGRRLESRGIDVFLLDDGYQHLQLARDVNILLIDASRPLGRDTLLPTGSLREPISAMDRADILVITRSEVAPGAQAAIEKLQQFPVFSATTRLRGFRRLGGGPQLLSADSIGSGPFYAFSGIGNPRAFLQDLKTWGLAVQKSSEFPDHHRYNQRDAEELLQIAVSSGAKAFVTTEKDAQNLAGVPFVGFPVFIAVIDLAVSNEENFLAVIREKIAQSAVAA